MTNFYNSMTIKLFINDKFVKKIMSKAILKTEINLSNYSDCVINSKLLPRRTFLRTICIIMRF